MPELPEVETVCRGLAPVMVGARFQQVEQRRGDLRFPFPEGFVARLEGRRLLALRRRAKYLVGDVEGGDALVMHLGMSGRFTINGDGHPVANFVQTTGLGAAHDHVVFRMSNGATITYNDPRRFGFMDLAAADTLDSHKLFAGLGPEPLSNAFNAAYLVERAVGRAVDLKAFLLDQRVVAGLGNIYVSEALFRAALSPRRRAATLAGRRPGAVGRAERLVAMIRDVLDDAIAAGGSTLRDYAHTDGSLGYFQHRFQVYGRAGHGCSRPGCAGAIRRVVQAQRATYYCPACQR